MLGRYNDLAAFVLGPVSTPIQTVADVAAAMAHQSGIDLTVELITHRVVAKPKAVLDTGIRAPRWTCRSRPRDERTKFGSEKQVYDVPTMRMLLAFFERRIADEPPAARILYWT